MRPPHGPYYRTDGHYRGDAPYFYDVDRLPWAAAMRNAWRAIRDEYEANVRRGTDHVIDVFNPAGPSVPGWRSVNFETYLWRYQRARRAFPVTIGLLEAIPGLASGYINVLEPHSAIPPHEGDSDAIIRCHLGLDVPPGDCAVRVGPETRRCANGSLLAFCDAHDHASWNRTDGRRVVLVFDVMRPEHQARRRWICANVLAATVVVWLEARMTVRRRGELAELRKSGRTLPFPRPVRIALRRAIAVPFRLCLPIQRAWAGRGSTPSSAPTGRETLSLRTLNGVGRRRYLGLHLAEHVLGPDRFGRVFGAARARSRARILAGVAGWPKDARRPVPELTFTSHAAFYRTHPDWEPAVFRGAARHWPCIGKWNLEFFARQYSDTRAVLIDQDGLYGEGEQSRYVVSTLGRLIAGIRAGQKESLRFLPIIDDNPGLKADLDMAWFQGFRSRFSIRTFSQFFLAPAGTYTPVHCALESNAFVQVHGRKRWLLWPARYQQFLEPPADRRPYFHTGYLPGRTSAEFPLGAYAPAYEVVLEEGDVLYVPPFVWHYVENVTATIAVAFRFFSLRAAMRSSFPMTVVKFLATRPSIFHTLVCPRRSLDRRCRVSGCPFALPEAALEAG